MMCYITVVGGEAEGRYVKLDGAKVRWHRDQLGWTLDDVAEQAEVAKGTVLRAEHGEDVRPSSGRRIARAFGIEIPELSPEKPGMALAGKAEAPATGRPKVQASLRPEEEPERRNPEPSDAQRRLAKVDELAAEYLAGRAEKHGAEVTDPNSPHFANATAATLWLAGVEDELAAWLDWREELQGVTMPVGEDFGAAVGAIVERFLVALGAVLAFDRVTERAEERIKAMNDPPDELAARRLEVSTAAREASRKRLEDPREAASGG